MKHRSFSFGLVLVACLSILATGCVFRNRATPQGQFQHTAPASSEQPEADSDPIKVLILLGQSNMVGFGLAEDFPVEMAAPSEHRLLLTDEGWVPLVPGERNGPEISLAYELSGVWPDETIGIIKVAVGGTGIRAFIPDWSEELADVTGDGHKGSLYAEIKARIDQAIAISEVEFIGVVWKQGGSDARNEETAAGYLDYLTSIIEALRQDTNTPTLPLFISTYYDAETLLLDPYALAEAPQIFAALFDIVMAHNLAQDVIPYTMTIATGWLPVTADGIHFNTEGQILHGQMIADVIWAYYELEMWGE
jgi:hypothetical protein